MNNTYRLVFAVALITTTMQTSKLVINGIQFYVLVNLARHPYI